MSVCSCILCRTRAPCLSVPCLGRAFSRWTAQVTSLISDHLALLKFARARVSSTLRLEPCCAARRPGVRRTACAHWNTRRRTASSKRRETPPLARSRDARLASLVPVGALHGGLDQARGGLLDAIPDPCQPPGPNRSVDLPNFRRLQFPSRPVRGGLCPQSSRRGGRPN